MSSFDWKKIIKDSIKDRLAITVTTTGIFYVLKAAIKTFREKYPGSIINLKMVTRVDRKS